MELKDKLELLWKYLILLVFVIIVSSHLCRDKFGHRSKGHPYSVGCKQGCWQHRGGHDFHSDAEDIQVEVKVENGDTTYSVTLDGEQLSNKDARAYIYSHGRKTHKIKMKHE